jgi:hypothetical protein
MRVFLTLFMLTVSTVSYAVPVTWYLEGAFDDGGSVSGSFVYDADSNVFSDIAVTTTAGSVFGGDYYDTPFSQSGSYVFAFNDLSGAIPGAPVIVIQSVDLEPMTNAGGEIAIDVSGSGETICKDLGCTEYTPQEFRFFTAGTISTVPIPAAVWLFGSALAGLGWMRRRKTV